VTHLTTLTPAVDFAAVLTDINMRGTMNGLSLANVAHERWPAMKIVLISGR
jgi:YesN/AraC family two-component response regulator